MELANEFSVRVPVEEAWAVLTDLERVAPCMPGFELQQVDGDEYRGVVKVKVGPMTAQYEGVASFRERDGVGHRAVIRAKGRDTRGPGTASATITATLEAEDGGTRVTLHTDLSITGKIAQFGRGVLADVSNELLGQFVKNLEADVLTGAPVAETSSAGPNRVDSRSREPVDLLATAGSSVIRRFGPLVAAVVVGLVLVLWLLRAC